MIGRRWRIIDQLGEGGFGQVYRVEDVSEVSLGPAALKVLRPNTTPRERNSFATEVKKIAKLRHQNLVGYLDSGQLELEDGTDEDGAEVRPFLVAELCDYSLDDALARRPGRTLTTGEVVSLLSDLTSGLAHLHRRGLIHRDIKPANVLFGDDDWKLADFGLMRDLSATGSYHRQDILIGTPHYMAPELFTTGAVTTASDLYALGVVAHISSAGRQLYQGSVSSLPHAILEQPPDIETSLDPFLQDLIGRLTQRDPADRPSVGELQQLIDEWPTAEPPGAYDQAEDHADSATVTPAPLDSESSGVRGTRSAAVRTSEPPGIDATPPGSEGPGEPATLTPSLASPAASEKDRQPSSIPFRARAVLLERSARPAATASVAAEPWWQRTSAAVAIAAVVLLAAAGGVYALTRDGSAPSNQVGHARELAAQDGDVAASPDGGDASGANGLAGGEPNGAVDADAGVPGGEPPPELVSDDAEDGSDDVSLRNSDGCFALASASTAQGGESTQGVFYQDGVPIAVCDLDDVAEQGDGGSQRDPDELPVPPEPSSSAPGDGGSPSDPDVPAPPPSNAPPSAASPTVSLSGTIVPSSRSTTVGDTATVYATLTNDSADDALGCSIRLRGTTAIDFTYQTVDAATNTPTGSPNTPVRIPGEGSQSFVLSLEPRQVIEPTQLRFDFDCSNAAALPTTPGVNTLQFSATADATPDIVAIAATQSADQTLHVPVDGADGFSLATTNVGAAGSITVTATADPGSLPLVLSVCPTDAATGACLAPASPSATLSIGAGATQTYSVFAAASGSIPYSPANSRVNVRFTDASGSTRGLTSVAVTTDP